jgi:hypothetical protein
MMLSDRSPSIAGRESMPGRFNTLDRLPLFADEDALAGAIMGPGKTTSWRQIVALLEGRGFPKIDAVMGGRYTPAVKAFFDRECRLHVPHQVASRDGPESLGTWKNNRNAAHQA